MSSQMKTQKGGGAVLPLEYFGRSTSEYNSSPSDSYNTAYGSRVIGSENNNNVYKSGDGFLFGSNLGPGGSTISSSGIMTGGKSPKKRPIVKKAPVASKKQTRKAAKGKGKGKKSSTRHRKSKIDK